MNSTQSSTKTLVIGIGNNGRRDDGLGWTFADAISSLTGDLAVEYRYQLQVEDAELISHYDRVVFVDACAKPLPGGFTLEPCADEAGFTFTTHKLDPASVLLLAQDLYHARTQGYVLAIEGENWGLGLGLSENSRSHLDKAVSFFLTDFMISAQTHTAA